MSVEQKDPHREDFAGRQFFSPLRYQRYLNRINFVLKGAVPKGQDVVGVTYFPIPFYPLPQSATQD